MTIKISGHVHKLTPKELAEAAKEYKVRQLAIDIEERLKLGFYSELHFSNDMERYTAIRKIAEYAYDAIENDDIVMGAEANCIDEAAQSYIDEMGDKSND